MKRVIRGIVTGSLVGAAVGLALLWRKKSAMMISAKNMRSNELKRQTRGTVKLVKDNTRKWSSVLKDGKEAISQRLARRIP